eukprot:EG_transcript_8168
MWAAGHAPLPPRPAGLLSWWRSLPAVLGAALLLLLLLAPALPRPLLAVQPPIAAPRSAGGLRVPRRPSDSPWRAPPQVPRPRHADGHRRGPPSAAGGAQAVAVHAWLAAGVAAAVPSIALLLVGLFYRCGRPAPGPSSWWATMATIADDEAQAVEDPNAPDLAEQIRTQVAFYFGKENLPRDTYLLKVMNKEGWVPLEEVARFRKMKALTSDRGVIVEALRRCPAVELSGNGRFLRQAGAKRKPRPAAPWEAERGSPCKYFHAGQCSQRGCVRTHKPGEGAVMEERWLRKGDLPDGRAPDLRFGGRQSMKLQPFAVYLILDLEGQDEIIELPVLALRAADLRVIGRFHRWVRPKELFDRRSGVRNPASNAVPFREALAALLEWTLRMEQQAGGPAAFVTCGDWDLKTQVPRQCSVSGIPVPQRMERWVNLKDVFNFFYRPQYRVTGMKGMLRVLQLGLEGTHHLGMDDVDNIARCAIRLMQDGAVLRITGQRNGDIGDSWQQAPFHSTGAPM